MNASWLSLANELGRAGWLRLLVWIVAIVALLPRIGELSVRVEKDTNEGWNAVWADRVARGEPIYFARDQLLANNYPPLSFFLLARAPDPLVAGRYVALFGLLATAAGVGWIARRTGGDGWIASGLLVAFVACHHSGYVAMNDPQWLAHAVMTIGLVVIVAGRGTGGSVPVAVAVMLMAGLIKHAVLPLPIALTWWFWRENRAGFWRWLIIAGVGFALALSWLRWGFGRECLENILGAPRHYSWRAGLLGMAHWSVVAVPLILVAWAGLRSQPDPIWRRLIGGYLLVALAWAIVTLGGDGVDRNVCFDAIIAATVAGSWVLARTDDRAWPWWVIAAAATLVVAAPMRWNERGRLQQHERVWAADIAWLKSQTGPVAAQRLGLVHWSGHPVAVENFLLSQRLQAGTLSPERVIEANVRVWVILPALDWPLAGTSGERLRRSLELVRKSENGEFYVRRAGAGM